MSQQIFSENIVKKIISWVFGPGSIYGIYSAVAWYSKAPAKFMGGEIDPRLISDFWVVFSIVCIAFFVGVNHAWISSFYPPARFKKAYPKFRKCHILISKTIARQKMSVLELEELKGDEIIIDAFHELNMVGLEVYDSVYSALTKEEQYNFWGKLCVFADKGKMCEARKFIKNLTLNSVRNTK